MVTFDTVQKGVVVLLSLSDVAPFLKNRKKASETG